MVICSFQWLIVGIFSVLHPLYVSVIEMNHNPKDRTVEISVRIFTDDFEATLKKYSKGKVDLLHPMEKTVMDKLVNNYISSRLKVKIDGNNVLLHYLGYEQQKESIWCYFEVENISSLKKVDINCNLLYDYQEKQMNIFHIKANGTEKSYKLDNPNTNAVFKF
jgi:hypothetical protein